jgi:CheY-like chemotaxis protein
MQGDRERCLEAGMDDYIAKPVSMADLAQAIERWGRVHQNSA